ncbi:MAG: FAD-dependent monooxygenase, partial [Aestuariivirga sp.]
MDDRPFLIAGGGIAGIAASLALARINRRSEVFERAAAFEEAGAGLQMSPNAVHCLRLLGAWDAIEPHCVIPSEIHIRDGRSGRVLRRIGLGKPFEVRFGSPYRVAHRADLLRGLVQTAQRASGIALHTGKAVESAETTDHGARLHFTNGQAAEGSAVIAADGINSVIRNAIVGGGEPSCRGHAIYRALLPFDKVPLSIAADCVTLWLYPGGHAVHYAVSNWRQFNMVAVLENPWREDGWGIETGKAEVVDGFADAADALAQLLTSVPAWTKFAAAGHAPSNKWVSGHVALIGDAAHASLPYLAQGAAMALEDACVLAKCLGA